MQLYRLHQKVRFFYLLITHNFLYHGRLTEAYSALGVIVWRGGVDAIELRIHLTENRRIHYDCSATLVFPTFRLSVLIGGLKVWRKNNGRVIVIGLKLYIAAGCKNCYIPLLRANGWLHGISNLLFDQNRIIWLLLFTHTSWISHSGIIISKN